MKMRMISNAGGKVHFKLKWTVGVVETKKTSLRCDKMRASGKSNEDSTERV